MEASGEDYSDSPDENTIDDIKHFGRTLFPMQPFSWKALVDFLRRIPYPFAERCEGLRVSRTVGLGQGVLVPIELIEHPQDESALILTWPTEFAELEESIVAAVTHIFELESNTRATLFEHPASDNLGLPPRLPVLRWEDSFSALISTIIEQQNSWVSATRGIHKLFVLSSSSVGGLSSFPNPEQFFSRPELLAELPITNKRKNLIRTLSEWAIEEPDFLEKLCVDRQKAESNLVKIPGIGPWTARVFLSKRYGHRPKVPYNDVALQRAAACFFGFEQEKLSGEELENCLSIYGDLAGEAAHRVLLRWVLERYPVRSGS